MVDVTPPAPPADRIEPVGLEVEMQRSYLDYAMSVIVGRALPSVQDGLKPVHRRVLYAMYDGGYRPDRGYVKCSRVVGDVMGNYHPHGDSSIYDTLVRLAQPWSMRVPLVDGNGNFGSQGDDPAAAMRYCVTGDTLIRLADGSSRRIADIAAEHGVTRWAEADVDMKVVGARGEAVLADKVFHSGDHATLILRTTNGLSVTGTHNHPILVLTTDATGQPRLVWKRLDGISTQDYVCALRTPAAEQGQPMTMQEEDLALLFGSWVSEGWYTDRAGFNNTDQQWFRQVEAAYERAVGGRFHCYRRHLKSGQPSFEMDVQNLADLDASPLAELKGLRNADKRIPNWVWQAGPAAKRRFLQALYEGDGSVSLLPRSAMQIAYFTTSAVLARGVQQLLLEFGIVSAVCQDTRRPDAYRTVITNRRDARIFAGRVGFLTAKRASLAAALATVPVNSRALSSDRVPHLAAWLRGTAPRAYRQWLSRHNIDRLERWERDGDIRDRLTPSALSIAEPLTDGTHYYARVHSITSAGVAPVYSLRIANDEHAFITNGLVSHNTEARLAPLAMEMLREIDQDTVDFVANYDGRAREPVVLPSRIPNLLVNGSGGIAVGMATNIPPHNLREVAAGVQWALANPDATAGELLEALLERIHGPDFPTAALIVGTEGISDAYRTGRGSIRMRAVVEVDEDAKGRTIIVITELPYQVNKDSLLRKIKELVEDQRIGGIAELNDEGSSRTGLRLVITLKRDAVAKVVLNNLYKHTQLQDTFGANMLAIVDGVPRTLRLDEMVSYYVGHQVEVIVRRTRYQLRKAEERAHILRGLAKALDRLDDVIALIRRAESADAARGQLMALLDIDELQATAILDMQLRRLAALERQRLIDELAEREREIADLQAILADPVRQRSIISTELAEITERYGDERRTRIVPFEGDMSLEDLIAQEDVVVTVTRGGYAKRTKTDLYRSQRRGGRGVQGAALRQDDLVEHFFVTTTHHWILFLTNQGRVYRAKAHELPEQNRAARGQHVANILAFAPDEKIAQVLDIRDYSVAPYLVLATKRGLVKKTALTEFDNGRSSGLIAINLRADDELIAAQLTGPDDDLMLVSRSAQSIRFTADDESLRPMGRATSGVIGMRFNSDDELLSMEVVREGADLLIATDGGYAKRTRMQEYPQQGRGGKGVLTAKIVSTRGQLVGALMVRPEEEVFAITSSGGVIRTTAREVRRAQRQTMGVRLINLDEGVSVVSIARNAEPEPAVVDALVEGRDPRSDAVEGVDPRTDGAASSGAGDGDE